MGGPLPDRVCYACNRAVGIACRYRDCLDGFGLGNSNRSCSGTPVTSIVVGKRHRTGRWRASIGGVVDGIAVAVGAIGRIAEVNDLRPKIGSGRQV